MSHRATILVTGGAGYVGSHACKALAAANYQPVTYDNLSTGHEWAVRWGPLEVGDLADAVRLHNVLALHKPAAVIHFAASAYVAESVADPAKYYRNNVVGSLSLLEAMRDNRVNHLVFSSTCSVFNSDSPDSIAEDRLPAPLNPYGASKLAIERMIADFGVAYGLRSAVLRYFNAAGADPDGEIGEAHDPEPHLIPRAIDAALGRTAEIEILGNDWPTPDGTCIRDYVHVSDLARAHVLALGYLLDGGPSTVVHLGSGQGYSVRQIIDTVGAIAGLLVPVRIAPRRPGDPAVLVASSERAKALLGWTPALSHLDTMIASAMTWARKRN